MLISIKWASSHSPLVCGRTRASRTMSFGLALRRRHRAQRWLWLDSIWRIYSDGSSCTRSQRPLQNRFETATGGPTSANPPQRCLRCAITTKDHYIQNRPIAAVDDAYGMHFRLTAAGDPLGRRLTVLRSTVRRLITPARCRLKRLVRHTPVFVATIGS